MIAELAGTAAHELNQPLTSVMGYAKLLRRRISPDDGDHWAADIIFRESERMAEIVRKIGRITRYETKEYLGNTRIVDLDRSTDNEHDTLARAPWGRRRAGTCKGTPRAKRGRSP